MVRNVPDYLGEMVVMATPFRMSVWKQVRKVRGRRVVVTMASSRWRWASCLSWGRMDDVTMATSFPL